MCIIDLYKINDFYQKLTHFKNFDFRNFEILRMFSGIHFAKDQVQSMALSNMDG